MYLFQTRDKNGTLHPNWKYQYTDYLGRRRTATGTRSKPETEKMAVQREAKQARIRAGLEPAPTSAQRHRNRAVAQVKDEYIAWGEAQGGRNGRPWSAVHARNRRAQLEWWKKQLGLDVLADLDNVLPHVEHALRRLQDAGKVGKTLQNVAETLKAFCAWCVQRGYLANDPLKSLAPFDTTTL